MTMMSETAIGRNTGIPLDMGWVRDTKVNLSATQNRANTLGNRRSIKKEWQAAWLLRAITMIDLTTLAGDDTTGKVTRLCAKAKQPLRQDIITALDVESLQPKVAARLRISSARPRRFESAERKWNSRCGRINRLPRRAQPI